MPLTSATEAKHPKVFLLSFFFFFLVQCFYKIFISFSLGDRAYKRIPIVLFQTKQSVGKILKQKIFRIYQ